ncbi:5059_t:CDS:2, partial [Ambispora gerdemannii]
MESSNANTSGLKYPEYWNRPYSAWGTLTAWDKFFKEKTRNLSLQDSRLCLTNELEILEGKFGPCTNQRKKVVALLRALKKGSVSLGKRKVDHENDDGNVCEVEELYVDVNEFPELLKYCQSIKEMQENHIDEISQSGRHLSILLKWSVVDSKLFKIPVTPPTISRPALNLHNLKVIFKEYPGLQADNILDALIEDKKIGIVRTNGWLEWLGLKKQNHDDYFHSVDTYTALSAIMSVLLYNPVQ